MKLNQAGIDLIKQFEKCSLKAYPDPATGGHPWTIGWGHTGSDVQPGAVWTQELCDATLLSDTNSTCSQLAPHIKTQLNDNQFSAVVSLAFNAGAGNIIKSTLLKLINADKLVEAANEFPKWDKAAGKVMQGLLTRRLAEQKLFNS